MTTTAEVSASVVINDGTRDCENLSQSASVTLATAMANGQRQPIALTAAFTALTVPSGAQGVMIVFVSGANTITLKGITGDTGIVISTAALKTFPILLPLGTSPSIGILSNGVGVVDVIWF